MFYIEHIFIFEKNYNYICLVLLTKKVTWRGRGAGIKNKIPGAGFFFAELMPRYRC